MELTFRRHGTEMTFHPQGVIEAADIPRLRDAVRKAHELSSGDMDSLRVDVSDSRLALDEALDVLADWYAECKHEDVPLRFVGVPRAARERFMERGIFDFDDEDCDADESPIVV